LHHVTACGTSQRKIFDDDLEPYSSPGKLSMNVAISFCH
jgi:hypothetical protein